MEQPFYGVHQLVEVCHPYAVHLGRVCMNVVWQTDTDVLLLMACLLLMVTNYDYGHSCKF